MRTCMCVCVYMYVCVCAYLADVFSECSEQFPHTVDVKVSGFRHHGDDSGDQVFTKVAASLEMERRGMT